MDVSYTRKVCFVYPFTGLFFIFIMILMPFRLCSQTVDLPQTCNESPSWIARWTLSSFSGSGKAFYMVDGSKVNFNDINAAGPWTFNVNFGILRHVSGIKLYSGSGQNSARTYQILVSKDSLLFTPVKNGILPYMPGAYDHLIDFNGYYDAKYIRIIFTDAYIDANTFSTNKIKLWEVNFLQCGVDPFVMNIKVTPGAIIVSSVYCADAISKDIQGVINTYFPGQTDALKGSNTIKVNINNARGLKHTLDRGDRVLIIQMQNALISETNSQAYGDGIDNDLIASGWKDVQNTGEYEFAIVESVSGDNIQLTQPLQKSYVADGVFQVVYSPVYDNVTITDIIKAVDWDGYCGGIVTFDAKTLHLNNQTIDVSAQGFRKGKMTSSLKTQYFWGTYCSDNDWYYSSKGEGIAGAPRGSYPGNSRRLYSPENTNLYSGGSFGRGAPGNAGGGGMDNKSGGGGGANIGSGGQGGASWGGVTSGDMTNYWNTTSPDGEYMNGMGYYPNGGMGGTGIGTADPFRVWMGGAGGNGFQNENNGTAGGNGGGIILATARVVKDNGYFKANGVSSDNSKNDGAGGGGAGGTIVFGFDDQSGATINYSATGGNGGNVNFDYLLGTGGGGGGGAIIVSANSTGMDIKGGHSGVNSVTLSQWGANKGMDGNILVSPLLPALYTDTCDRVNAPFFGSLYVPNTFIPGSRDQSINTFKPVGRGVIDYTILIYDLWGNMIWSSNLVDKNGSPLEDWDGNNKHGKPYPTGAYIWRIKAILEGNKLWKGMEIPYKSGSYHTQGTITIIR